MTIGSAQELFQTTACPGAGFNVLLLRGRWRVDRGRWLQFRLQNKLMQLLESLWMCYMSPPLEGICRWQDGRWRIIMWHEEQDSSWPAGPQNLINMSKNETEHVLMTKGWEEVKGSWYYVQERWFLTDQPHRISRREYILPYWMYENALRWSGWSRADSLRAVWQSSGRLIADPSGEYAQVWTRLHRRHHKSPESITRPTPLGERWWASAQRRWGWSQKKGWVGKGWMWWMVGVWKCPISMCEADENPRMMMHVYN